MPGHYHGSGYQPADQRLIALPRPVAMRCRNRPYLDQGGALRAPRAGACARPLPWEARPTRAGPSARTPLINRLTRRHSEATWGAVFLGDSSSRSRPHAAGKHVRVGLRTAPRSTPAGLRPIASADRGMARLDVPVAQVTCLRPGRPGVRPGLRRVHPQAPGHPARCLPRGNEGGFPLTLAHSPTRGIVGSSTIGIGVSTSPAWEILVQARSKDCGQHGAAGPDPHLA
jgi:hypothetical protein